MFPTGKYFVFGKMVIMKFNQTCAVKGHCFPYIIKNLIENARICPGLLHHNQRAFSSSTGQKKNPYEILKITPKATASEIKNAYYLLSKQYHPDHFKESTGREDREQLFRDVTDAYEILSNAKKRQLYDTGDFNFDSVDSSARAAEMKKSADDKIKFRPSHNSTSTNQKLDFSQRHISDKFIQRQEGLKIGKQNKKNERTTGGHEETIVICLVMAICVILVCLFD